MLELEGFPEVGIGAKAISFHVWCVEGNRRSRGYARYNFQINICFTHCAKHQRMSS